MNHFIRNHQAHQIQNPPFLKIIYFSAVAYMIYYLWWRAAATLNPSAPLFSWMLWLAEAFGVLSYILFGWMTQDISPKVNYRRPRPGMSVDVFVPTYNESLEILEATLTGCKKIKYPHTICVLDDGKRIKVQELAERLGCQYITRPTPEHAKAGNINHALGETNGDFIVLLDADMVPQPDFLDRTLGYFEDKKLAVIQLPQEFYNQDSIQHDKSADHWHEQSLFFRVIQPGKNYSQSAFWCGSPSLVRRAALEDIGGVATETITEDIHTTVRLHSHGWTSLFLNEELAFGIAPQTIRSFLIQRLRWAQGTMQLYRSKESPIWIPGLTLKQRLSYLSSFLAYFESFQKLIFIMTPIIIIVFNVFPLRTDFIDFLVHWAPYFAFNILANQAGGRGYFRYFQTEKYNILKTFVFIQSTLMLFHRKALKFKVTPKSVDQTVYKNEVSSLRSYMSVLGLVTAAILFGLFRIFAWKGTMIELETLLIAVFWGMYNEMIIMSGIWEVLRTSHERQHYRFPVALEGDLYDPMHSKLVSRIYLDDLSVSGAGFHLDKKLMDIPDGLIMHFHTPDDQCIVLPVKKIHRQQTDSTGKIRAGMSFIAETGPYRARLFEYLFVYLARYQVAYRVKASRSENVHIMAALTEYKPLAFESAQVAKDGAR